MKYRTDFVTNSSSSNFGSAIIDIIIGTFGALGIGSCNGNASQPEAPEAGDDTGGKNKDYAMETSITEGTLKTDGQSLIWVYAKVNSLKPADENGNLEDTSDLTNAITFSKAGTYGDLLNFVDYGSIDGFKCVCVTASAPTVLDEGVTSGTALVKASASTPSGPVGGSEVVNLELIGLNARLETTVRPEGATDLTLDDPEAVTVYARFVTEDPDQGEVTDKTTTAAISIEKGKNGEWLAFDDDIVPPEDWKVRDLRAIAISGEDSAVNAPESASVVIRVTFNNKKFEKEIPFTISAKPEIKIDKQKVSMLSGSRAQEQVSVRLIGAGGKDWDLDFNTVPNADEFFDISRESSDKPEDKNTWVFTIVEQDDTDSSTGLRSSYDSCKVQLTATCEDKSVTDYFTVTVNREGLLLDVAYTSAFDQEKNAVIIRAEKDNAGEMKKTRAAICFMQWNSETRQLESDAEYVHQHLMISDIDAEDDVLKKVLGVTRVDMIPGGIGGGNTKAAYYNLSLGTEIPGKPGEELLMSMLLTCYGKEEKAFELKMPVLILPAQLSEQADWDLEYGYCKEIIERFLDGSIKASRLAKLENDKYSMGVDELRMFRKACWETARFILMQEFRDYKEAADIWDSRLFYLETTQWVVDQCFSVTASLALAEFGPMGPLIADQVYKSIYDVVSVSIDKWDQDWFTLGTEIIWKRVGGFTGKAIDTAAFSKPEFTVKWVAQYAAYRIVWHWFWDYESNGKRKGFTKAIKSTGWDLAGQAFKTNMKSFLKNACESCAVDINKDTKVSDVFESSVVHMAEAFKQLEIQITY